VHQHPALRRILAIFKRALHAPWSTFAREVFRNRFARHGDLQLLVMDLRRKELRNPAELVRVTSEALSRISAAGQGFGELVTSHLQAVVAAEDPSTTTAVSVRAYASDFRGHEAQNGHYLACQLVWAATATRLTWDARRTKRVIDQNALRDACWEAQKRFLSQFQNAYEWIEYLDPDHPHPPGSPLPGAA
jgi:hypothetical protein